MTKFKIRTPIWKNRSVGLAESKLSDNNMVEILYKTKEGNKPFPYNYFITKEKALTYPTQIVKGTTLHIIPISDLQKGFE